MLVQGKSWQLGFVVSSQGIKVDLDKAKVIQVISMPKKEKEVRSFLRHLNYIARFISQLIIMCELIFLLLRKKNHRVWNNDCQKAFDIIKRYLQNLPLIAPSTLGRPFILYLIVTKIVMASVVDII